MYFTNIVFNIKLYCLFKPDRYHSPISLDHPVIDLHEWDYEVIDINGHADGGIIFNPNEKGFEVYLEFLWLVSFPFLFIIRWGYIYLNIIYPFLIFLASNLLSLIFITSCMVSWTVLALFLACFEGLVGLVPGFYLCQIIHFRILDLFLHLLSFPYSPYFLAQCKHHDCFRVVHNKYFQ